MALWSRPEPATALAGGPGEFLGRTPDEAIARARETLGSSVELRCWKTRRGGVAGFFATEVYIAGVTPPAGADVARGKSRRAQKKAAATVSAPVGATLAEPVRELAVRSSVAPPSADPDQEQTSPDPLAELVERTTDQLSLRLDALNAESFDAVLAEAEAAIAEGTTPPPDVASVADAAATDIARTDSPIDEDGSPTAPITDVARPTASGVAEVSTTPAIPRDPTPRPTRKAPGINPAKRKQPAAKAKSKPKPRATPPPPSPAAAAAAAPTAAPGAGAKVDVEPTGPAPQPIPDLFDRLRVLGVPDRHLPRGNRPTLDALVRSLSRLPAPPDLPSAAGAVVVLVGTRVPTERTVRLLLGDSPFLHGPKRHPDRRVWETGEPDRTDDLLGTVLQTGAPAEVAGRVAMRKVAGRVSLVPIESTPGAELRPNERAILDAVGADFVLGAVEATVKRADVERWSRDLGRLDALALWGLDSTASPADLLGSAPIAFVDGELASPMGWTVSLLSRAMEEDR